MPNLQQTPQMSTLIVLMLAIKRKQSGFTIVELLIVIVIIAILATLVTVGYNGIQERAAVGVLKSDLKNGAEQLGVDNVRLSKYPATVEAADGGKGLTKSDGTTFQYTYTSADNTFCLTATSSRSGVPAFHIADDNGPILDGPCPGHSGPGDHELAVTTLAGSGAAGFVDGTGTSAQFKYPRGLAVDSSGNIYVADQGNNRIRKITPAGVVTTFAGSGVGGFANGTGTSAQFFCPYDVAIDSANNLYVADACNHRIRKISPSAVVTTLAGSGVNGYADGTGTSAQFWGPDGVAVDSAGNVYVGDTSNGRLRKITPAGVVTTLAGSGAWGYADGNGTNAQFTDLGGVAVDSAGNVYVADSSNGSIRKVTSSGNVTTLAGSGVDYEYADGTGADARFYDAADVAVDSAGNVYVADTYNCRIRKITPSGVVTTVAGAGDCSYADGAVLSAQFNSPFGIAVDSSGTIYVGDTSNNRIRVIK